MDENIIKKDKKLREIDYGDDEGLHFKSLANVDKERINSIDYKAPNGESWK